jgi:hypothetical protein
MYNTVLKEKIMFIDSTIDTIQTSQKAVVKTFVQNESIADLISKVIDMQSDYTKKVAKTTTEVAVVLTEEVVKSTKDLTKFDLFKFGETLTSFARPTTKSK